MSTSESNLSDPPQDIPQPPGCAPPLSSPPPISPPLHVSVEKRKREHSPKNSVALINTNRQTSPTNKKAKENSAALSDEIASRVSISRPNIDCLAIDHKSFDDPEYLWLNDSVITAYFCRKIMIADFNRNLNHRILFVDPGIWQRRTSIKLTHWGTSRRAPDGCLLTIPKYLPAWEYVFIPIHVQNHWFLAVGDRFSMVTVYDTLGGKHPSIDRGLENIMDLVGGGRCQIKYAICGKDFQQQKNLWECGYDLLIISEKLLRGENNLFQNLDEIIRWREHAHNLLQPFVGVTISSYDDLLTRVDNSADDDDFATSSHVVVKQQTDMPSTSAAAAAAARTQPIEINEQVTNDDGSFLLTFYEQDTNCLSINYEECEQNGNMAPLWFTDTAISAIFIVKILAEHSKRINRDNILLVNPLIWRDMAATNKSKYDSVTKEYVTIEGEFNPAKLPDCWHTNGDENKMGIATFPSHLDNWDRVVIPVHVDNNHWTIAIAVRTDLRIYYYDTLGYEQRELIEYKLQLIMRLLGCENMVVEYPICGHDYVHQTDEVGAWTCGAHICILGDKIISGNNDFFYDLPYILDYRRIASDLLANTLHILDLEDQTPVTAKQLFDAGCSLLDVVVDRNVEIADNVDNDVIEVNEPVIGDQVSRPTARKRDIVPLRRESARLRMKKSRETESSQQKTDRLNKVKDTMAASRSSMTPQQKSGRLAKKQDDTSHARKKPIELDTFKIAFMSPSDPIPEPWNQGKLGEKMCEFCEALFYPGEAVGGKCCAHGQVRLPTFDINYPNELKRLFTDKNHNQFTHFRKYVRMYNGLLAPISRVVEVCDAPEPGKQNKGGLMYKIKGTVDYLIGSLKPKKDRPHAFLQLYLFSAADAAARQFANMTGSIKEKMKKANLLTYLHEILRKYYTIARDLKTTYELALKKEEEEALNQDRPVREIQINIVRKEGDNRSTHNLPTSTSEIAVLFPPTEKYPVGDHPMYSVCSRPDGKLYHFPFESALCDTFIYPLIHIRGQLGWNERMQLFPKVTGKKTTSTKGKKDDDDGELSDDTIVSVDKLSRKGKMRERVTMAQFYRFHCFQRPNWSPIIGSGALFLQWATESAHKIEQNRLVFYRNPEMQKKFRVETFVGLQDFVNDKAKEKGVDAGKMVLLPPDYKGSQRDMANAYQDSMCMVQKLGMPTYFITITMNSTLIEADLKDYETKYERVDLVDRVFELMLKELLDDIEKKKVLGTCIGRVYVCEFQKRGGKHAHIVIIMDKEDVPRTPEEIDKVICAEIPDPKEEPELYELIMRNNIHGPCGSRNRNCVCMEDDGSGKKSCIRKFPKKSCGETNISKKGRVEYRRRCLKSYSFGRKQQYHITDADVVPFSRYFTQKFRCHINVELVGFAAVIKYLYKYIYKGEAWARIELLVQGNIAFYDEIRSYQLCKYLSANQAVHEILQDLLYSMSHKVTRLVVHLPGEENLLFEQGGEKRRLRAGRMTTLKAFFALNDIREKKKYDPNAAQFLYVEIPQHYTWIDNDRWKARVKRGYGDRNLTRLPYRAKMDKQTFALRMLLLNVAGPSSFESLRTVNGHLCKTFHEAALELGLITDTKQIILYITEAASTMSGKQLRLMFSILICNIIDFSAQTISELWLRFRDLFCDDFELKLQSRNLSDEARWELAYGYGLIDMEKLIRQCTANMNNRKVGLDEPPNLPPIDQIDEQIEKDRHKNSYAEMYDKVTKNSEQKKFVDAVIHSLNSTKTTKQRLFFLHASGGTGKTFCLNTLIHFLRSQNHDDVIAVAFTGIAAILLDHGRTAHSKFKINKQAVCDIRPTDKLGKLIRRCKLIIIDEVSMMSNKLLDKIDRTLRDIAVGKEDKNSVFGGKIVILAGDLRQNLPVIQNSDKNDILNECVVERDKWCNFETYSLTRNMRLDENETAYQEWLLRLGEGKIEQAKNCCENEIRIDPRHIVPSDSLVDTIFDQSYIDSLESLDLNVIANSVILTPRNDSAIDINEAVFAKLSDKIGRVYNAVDSTETMDDPIDDMIGSSVPNDLLNEYTPHGFPLFKLHLRKYCVVMIIRNLNIDEGLVNGTRLIVVELYPHSIECIILTGARIGEHVRLFPIDFLLDETEHPLKMRRHQLPIRPSFAMTIHKSQGQTFCGKVGLSLKSPIFAHGQLYVACSRVTNPNNFYIELAQSIDPNRAFVARNIVYKEVFSKLFLKKSD